MLPVRARQFAAVAIVVAGLSACSSHARAPVTAPLPTATSPGSSTIGTTPLPSAPTSTTLPPRSTTVPAPPPATTRRPTGDLTITLAGSCTFYEDSARGLWINPTLQAHWTGTAAPFPANGFSMTSNYGKATAGGPVTSTAPFTWAIGGEPAYLNSWLGHTVQLTVTIDAVHEVTESNEANNVTVIDVVVPATYSTTEVTIPCSVH